MSNRTRVRLNASSRVQLEFEPEWEPVIKRWTAGYIQQNKWRLDPILEISDLLQDSYLIFLKLKDYYPRVVEAPHFMSLYKTSIKNFIHDKAAQKRKMDEVFLSMGEDAITIADRRIGEIDGGGYLAVLLREAPPELKLLLEAFTDQQFLEQLRKPTKKKGVMSTRDSFNTRLCKILNLGSRNTKGGRVRKQFDPDLVNGLKSLLHE